MLFIKVLEQAKIEVQKMQAEMEVVFKEKSLQMQMAVEKGEMLPERMELELQKEQDQLDAKKVLAGIKKFQKMFGTKAKLDIRKYPKSIGTIATVALPAGTEKGSPEQFKKHKDMQKAIKALKLPVSKLDSVKGQATFWVQYGVDESVTEGKKSTDWEVTYDNNNIGGKKIKKGTTVKVKARNSEEAHKKAAKKLGVGDSYMALKGRAKRLGESVNEAQKENVGNLFIVKDDNGHIHLEIGGRSGQMNLGHVGGKKLKEFLSKLIKLSKK